MDFVSFEDWLKKLTEGDLEFLHKNNFWRKAYQQAQKKHILPKGFVEKTMEILEGGSESET